MEKVINGKLYNTDNAEEIATFRNGEARNDFKYMEETLYKTKKGNYFLAGEGGALSKYSVPVPNGGKGGSKNLQALSEKEAYEWLENHGKTTAIKQHFADKIEKA